MIMDVRKLLSVLENAPASWPARTRKLWQSVGRFELTIIILSTLVIGGIWLFVGVAGEVMEGDTQAFDETLVLALRNPADRADPIGPLWLEEIGRDLTALGGVAMLTILVTSVVAFLFLQGTTRAAYFVTIAVIGGVLLGTLLKEVFARPRPDLVPHLSYVYTASFPSGHSLNAAVVYLTLGVLLARLQKRRVLKLYVMVVAAAVTIAVGISRVYLGVHWPTDVLAGWTAGAVWALCCWSVMWWLQRRGEVESQDEATAQETALPDRSVTAQ
jgi:undecaprenyl-diphosphatase